MGAMMGAGGNGAGNGAGMPLLGNALGPVAKSILDASALLPVLKEVMKFADPDGTLKAHAAKLGVDPHILKPSGPPPLPNKLPQPAQPKDH
jgi:hypothetical protein